MSAEPANSPDMDEEAGGGSAPLRDAGIEVRVDRERMWAKVVIPAGLDGATVTEQLLAQYARERGIAITSAAEKKLTEIAESYRAAGKPVEEIFAEATPPRHGRDAGLEWVEGFDPEADRPVGAVGEGERVDFYNQVSYVSVQPDDHVATVVEPTAGEDGLDVTGAVIAARRGKDLDLQIDPSLDVRPDGCVVAKIGGVLELKERCLSVTRLLEVPEHVDFSTGNIIFDGSVVVRQGVRDRFVVKASGSVTVEGLVEAATIISGGDFFCRRGMAAKDRGQVLVDGDAHVGYFNNVRARVKGNLLVRRELMDCELVVGKSLVCDQGAIVGGRAIVTGEVHAATLGSAGGTLTTLVLGEVPLAVVQLHRLESMMREYRQELDETTQAYRQMSSSKVNLRADEKERITELGFRVSELGRTLQACETKREELLEHVRQARMVRLLVYKVIHPRVLLKIGGREYLFEETVKGPVTIGWDAHRNVRFRIGEGESRSLHDITREINLAA